MSQSELEKCPFCGSGHIDIRVENSMVGIDQHINTLYEVRCRRCFCKTSLYADINKAISAWNRRPTNKENNL